MVLSRLEREILRRGLALGVGDGRVVCLGFMPVTAQACDSQSRTSELEARCLTEVEAQHFREAVGQQAPESLCLYPLPSKLQSQAGLGGSGVLNECQDFS